jgi:hypothetical protein
MQLPSFQLSWIDSWPTSSRPHQQHAADLQQSALALFGQPDPRTAWCKPATTNLRRSLLLREEDNGSSDLLPAAWDASFTSSAARVASALSITTLHLDPFSPPASSAYACWHFLHAHFPHQCPSPSEGINATTSAQLSWLPTKARRTLAVANHAQLARLSPAASSRPFFTATLPDPVACG